MTVERDEGFRAEAKRLLKEQLRNHADPGVRAMNEIAEPADDHPAVIRIAAALAASAPAARGNES